MAEQLKVGRFIAEIDGDRTVVPRCFGGLCHVSSPLKSRWMWMGHREDNALKWQSSCERDGGYHVIRWNVVRPSVWVSMRPCMALDLKPWSPSAKVFTPTL